MDLGTAMGQVCTIRPGGWEVSYQSPVLFRRTALTGTLPEPQPGGGIDALRDLLNASDENRPLIGLAGRRAAATAATSDLLIGGEQGTGKSTAAWMLAALFDPSSAELRSPPRNEEQWAVTAAGGWCVPVDNVSTIPRWWSDALCRAVTGDGWLTRKLYSNNELAVLRFKRAVILTSIDAGALRDDLGDRLLLVDLERIAGSKRRTDRELQEEYARRRPLILGALLDLVAAVLSKLPDVRPCELPRMADFACVLAAVDKVLGTAALPTYLGQRGRIAANVLEADSVGAAIQRFMLDRCAWELSLIHI